MECAMYIELQGPKQLLEMTSIGIYNIIATRSQSPGAIFYPTYNLPSSYLKTYSVFLKSAGYFITKTLKVTKERKTHL